MPYLKPAAELHLDQSLLKVHFSDEVLWHFHTHKQDRLWKCEAGGQLFARITGDRWEIVKATGPRQADYRRRFRFFPSRKEEQLEIDRSFDDGLHYVGDWHTHPERTPTPSALDVTSMNDLVRKSKREIAGFLMVIVGTQDSARGLWVSFHTAGGGTLRLTE